MINKAVWKYIIDINMFNFTFCLVFELIMGFLWSIIMFTTFGILIGYLGFQTFKKNEYYMYYNLGFSKFYLLKKVCVVNLVIASILILITLIIS